MNLTGPVLLIVGPLLGALTTLIVSRWRRVMTVVGVAITWLLWTFVKTLPLAPTSIERANRLFAGDSFSVFDHSLLLSEGIRALFLFLLMGLSVLFLLSLAFPQGRNFVSGSLATLSPLAAALMIETLAISTLLLLVSFTILVMVIQSDKVGLTRPALRYLIMGVLTVPLFLVTGWMLSGEQAALQLPASRLLLVGFAILMAGFPFHIWVSPLVVESTPLVSAFIFGLVQLVLTAFVFDLLLSNPWLGQDELFIELLQQSGILAILVATLMALTATGFGRLLASALLLDMGMSVLTLAVGGPEGWKLAVSLQMARFVSLILATVGLSQLQRGGPVTTANRIGRGQITFGVVLFFYGCISLIGLPLTVGFSGRWAIIIASGQVLHLSWLPYFLLLAMIVSLLGFLQNLLTLLSSSDDEVDFLFTNSLWLKGLSAFTLMIGGYFAIFPQVLNTYAYRLADLLR